MNFPINLSASSVISFAYEFCEESESKLNFKLGKYDFQV